MSKKPATKRTVTRRTANREWATLRARVRAIIIEHGTPVAPWPRTVPASIDDLISELADRQEPTLRSLADALYARISDTDLGIEISDHAGSIMATYADAGYFVGLAAGIEFVALTAGSRKVR
jgi:hypothetical protein